jgi:hypothetical protein
LGRLYYYLAGNFAAAPGVMLVKGVRREPVETLRFAVWLRAAKFVAGCVMLTAIALAGAASDALAQDPANQDKDKNEILVKTPWGSLEAQAAADARGLKLPVYPGVKLLNDKESSPLHAELQFGGKPSIKFAVGKFVTPDNREKVRAFYQKKLGKQVTKFTEKDDEGSTVFEIEQKLDQRYVELKNHGSMTEVDLIHLEGVESDSKDK